LMVAGTRQWSRGRADHVVVQPYSWITLNLT
jgi:hypothetical protein